MSGRAQVNYYFPWEGIDFPTLDFCKQANVIWTASGSPSEDANLLLDARGFPTKIASGSTSWTTQTIVYKSSDPDFVLKWNKSSATISLSGTGISLKSSSAGRNVYTLSSVAADGSNLTVTLTISALTFGDHPTSIQLCRSSEEALLDAGEIWAPHFIAMYNPWGRNRYMDWGRTNANPLVKWEHRSVLSDFSWRCNRVVRDSYFGRATNSVNAYTVPSAIGGAAWTHGQMVQCVLINAPSYKLITAATKANPCQLTVAGHGWSTGKFVRIGLFFSGMTQLVGVGTTITVLDADHFTLDGVNSTSYTTFTASANRTIFEEITVTDGVLPAKRVVQSSLDATSIELLTAEQKCTLIYDSDLDVLMLFNGFALTGVPLDAIIDQSNKLNVPPWICIPTMANDDYVLNAAMAAFNNLRTSFVIPWEFGNEEWNIALGFEQTLWCDAKANALFGIPRNTNGFHEFYGYRFHQVMTIIGSVFAGQMNRVERVMAVWTAFRNSSQTTPRFTAPHTGLPSNPITLADSIAIAGYYAGRQSTTADAEQVWKYKQGGSSRQEAIEWYAAKQKTLDGTTPTTDYLRDTVYPEWMAISVSYTNDRGNVVGLTQYEGGPATAPGDCPLTASSWNGDALTSTDRNNFIFGASESPECGEVARQNLDNFIAAGGKFPSQYCLVAPWGTSGMWGVIHDNIFGTQTGASDALLLWNNRLRRVRLTATA